MITALLTLLPTWLVAACFAYIALSLGVALLLARMFR